MRSNRRINVANWCGLLAAVWLGASCCSRGLADNAPNFRRVEIPAEAAQTFIDGLIPRPRNEFEQLTKPTAQTPSPWSFAEAKFSAKLKGQQLLQGTAECIRSATAMEEVALPLSTNLAISGPVWVAPDGTHRPALWGTKGPDTVVMAQKSSPLLRWTWSKQGQSVGDLTQFELRLPAALVYRLQIEIEDDIVVQADHGVVDRSIAGQVTIRWSGRSKMQVVAYRANDGGDAAAPQLTQHTDYLASLGHSEVSSELRLLSGLAPLEILRLAVDPRIRVTEVTAEGNSLPWVLAFPQDAVESRGIPDNREPELLVELPRPLPASIRIQGIASSRTDVREPLPRMRPKNVKWFAETANIAVRPPLEVVDIQTSGARCFDVQTRSDGTETYLFAMDDQRAKVDIQFSPAATNLQAQGIAAVVLDRNSVAAEVTARLTTATAAVHKVIVPIAPGWTVEESIISTLAAQSASSLAARWEQQDQGLVCYLRNAITPERPAELKLRLVHEAMPNPLTLDRLMPLLPDAAFARNIWVHARSANGLQLRAAGTAEVHWPSQQDLMSQLPSWVEAQLASSKASTLPGIVGRNQLLFTANRPLRQVQLWRETIAEPTAVDALSEVTVDEQGWQQTIRLRVVPGGQPVRQLNLRFNRRVPASAWRMNTRQATTLVEAEVRDGETERQRLIFPEPLTDVVDLWLELEDQHQHDAFVVPLPTIQGIGGGSAYVALYGTGGTAMEVAAQDLNAIPQIPTNWGTTPPDGTFHGAFSYRPNAAYVSDLVINPHAEAQAAALQAWRVNVRSYFAETGRPRHRVDYLFQNDGSQTIDFTVPRGFTLEAVEVNRNALKSLPLIDDREFTVPLPTGVRHPSVSLRYVGRSTTLPTIDWLDLPAEFTTFPSLQTTWQVWLPRDYAVYDPQRLPPSQDGWLARIFGPFTEQQPLAKAWPHFGLRRWPSGTDEASVLTRQIVNELGLIPTTSISGDQSTSWGDTLTQIEQTIRRTRPRFEILVDREEFRRLGIGPKLKLPTSRYASSRQAGVDRLQRFGLGILVDQDRAVFTSGLLLRELSNAEERLFDIAVEGSTSSFTAHRLARQTDWALSDDSDLWPLNNDSLEVGVLAGGWRAYHQEIQSSQPALKIYHRDTVAAFSYSLFFLTNAAGWWIWRRRRARWLYATGIAFATAQLLPQPGASMAIAAAWGFVCGAVLSVFSRRAVFSRNSVGPRRPTEKLRMSTALVVLAMCITTFQARGQVPAPVDVPASVERVLFPRDETGQLLDHVYLTPTFYQQLRDHQRQSPNRLGPLWTQARYDVRYVPASLDGPEHFHLFVAYGLTTLRADQQVQLPNHGDPTLVVRESLRLDREQVANASPNTWALELPRQGDYDVSYELRVPVTRSGNRRQLRMPIPSIAQSQLQLRMPRRAVAAAAPSALGATSTDSRRDLLKAELGSTSELVITLDLPVEEVLDGQEQIDQLLLVQFIDDEVFVETRFRFAGEPQPLRLQVESGWQPALRHSLMDWQPDNQTMDIRVLPPEIGPQWKRPWPAAAGRLRVPSIEPLGVRVRERLVAVQLPPGTSPRFTNATDVLSQDEFANLWGELPSEVSHCFAADLDAPLELQLTGNELAMRWRNTTSYFFAAHQATFRAKLELSPPGPGTTRKTACRLNIPESLDVEQLIASSSFGSPLRIRWREVGPGQVAVLFLDQPVVSESAPLEIQVTGTLQANFDEDVNLPLITSAGQRDLSDSHRIWLYEAPHVEVRAAPNASLASNVDSLTNMTPAGYRFLGSWTSSAAETNPSGVAFSVSVKSHHRRLRGSQTTRLVNDDNQWIAETEILLDGVEGSDALEVDLPRDLASKQPQAFSQEMELRVDAPRTSPLRDRLLLTVWLPESATQQTPCSVTLRATMDQEQTRLPSIRVLNLDLTSDDERRHIVELPNAPSSADARFLWNYSGLVEIESLPGADYSRYRVVRDRYSAVLDEVQSGSLEPATYLVDSLVRLQPPHRFVAIVTYNLAPANESVCFAQIPTNVHVSHLFVDDRRMPLEHVGQGNDPTRLLRIPLVAKPWPHQVRVLLHGRLSFDSQGLLQVQVPQLLTNYRRAIRTDRELWTLFGPDELGAAQTTRNDDKLMSASQRDQAIVVAFTQLWTGAQRSIRERSTEEKAAWLTPWARRLQKTTERLPLWDDDAQLRPFQQLLADYPDVFQPLEPVREVTLDDLWSESQRTGNSLTYVDSQASEEDQFPTIELRYRAVRSRSWQLRVGIAFVILSGVVAIPRSAVARNVLPRLQQFPLALSWGLAAVWWMLLSPAWLGPVVATITSCVWLWGTTRRTQRWLRPSGQVR